MALPSVCTHCARRYLLGLRIVHGATFWVYASSTSSVVKRKRGEVQQCSSQSHRLKAVMAHITTWKPQRTARGSEAAGDSQVAHGRGRRGCARPHRFLEDWAAGGHTLEASRAFVYEKQKQEYRMQLAG